MRRAIALFLVAAGFAAAPRPLAAEEGAGLTLVRGRFLDEAIAGVIVRDGRIAEVLAPGDARVDAAYAKVIDGGDAWILPGLVDAGGMTGDAARAAADPITPEHLAIDGFDPFARNRTRLERGVTTTWLSPNRARLLTGRGAVVKTAGASRVLEERAALWCTLGPEGLNPPAKYDPPLVPHPFDAPLPPALPRPPSSRAKAVEMLREALAGVKDPVRVRASGADEIALALDLATALKLRAIFELDDAEAALPFAGRLAGAGAIVLETTGPPAERLRRRIAGVALSVAPGAPRDLLATAAAAGDHAFASVTIDAARAIGVADRVGSLEAGKDADLIFVLGDPASAEAVVQKVIVDGEVVYEREPRAGVLAIRARRILIGDGEVVENGVVVCADGRIVDVGADVTLPPDAERLTFAGTVVPGFVDAWSHVGLPGGDTHEGAAAAASPDPERLDDLRRAGVTALVLVPRSGTVVGGDASVVKTSLDAGAWRTIALRPAVLLNFGTDGDRAVHAQSVRDSIEAARKYIAAWESYGKADAAHRQDPKKAPKPNPPKRDPNLEALSEVLQARRPALVRAERSEEIAAMLAFGRDDAPDAQLHLLGGRAALDHAEALRARDATVILAGLPGVTLDDGTRASLTIELSRRHVAVSTGSAGSAVEPLAALAALVRGGLSPRRALASVTAVPADALGVGTRIGRIARGGDADLVLLTHDPGEPGCRVHAVVADGVVVHREEERE